MSEPGSEDQAETDKDGGAKSVNKEKLPPLKSGSLASLFIEEEQMANPMETAKKVGETGVQ